MKKGGILMKRKVKKDEKSEENGEHGGNLM